MLAKTLGVKKLILAINKMDDPTVSCPCAASAASQPAWRTWLRADASRAPERHARTMHRVRTLASTHSRPHEAVVQVEWAESRFLEIKGKLEPFMKRVSPFSKQMRQG